MSLLALGGGGALIVDPITLDADWGVDAGDPPTATMESAIRTLTVPVNNPGSVRLNIPAVLFDGTKQYRKNSGTYTTFTHGDEVAFANGDTLQFRVLNYTAASSGGSNIITAIDIATSDLMGTWELDIP